LIQILTNRSLLKCFISKKRLKFKFF